MKNFGESLNMKILILIEETTQQQWLDIADKTSSFILSILILSMIKIR